MSHSIIAPRRRVDILLGVSCEYLACFLLSSLVWGEWNFGTAAVAFAGLYVIRVANWLLVTGCSLLNFWVERRQRVDALAGEMHRLGMPQFTDAYVYDQAPSLITEIAQRNEICEDLRSFLQRMAGEMSYLRSNRRGLAYVTNLAILNAALEKVRNELSVPVPESGPVKNHNRRLALKAA